MANFEVGKEYYCSSACDHNCIWTFTVISRTDKSVRVQEPGEKPVTRRIKSYDGVEFIRPFGSYSMAPILRANNEVRQEQEAQPSVNNVVDFTSRLAAKKEQEEIDKCMRIDLERAGTVYPLPGEKGE